MTKESIFEEFKRQGLPLNDSGRICFNGRLFNFMPAIESWFDGSLDEYFADVMDQMNEETIVSQLIKSALTEKVDF